LAGRGLESRERLEQMFEPAVMDDDGGRLGCLGDLHCGEDYRKIRARREPPPPSAAPAAGSVSRPGSTRAFRAHARKGAATFPHTRSEANVRAALPIALRRGASRSSPDTDTARPC